MNIILLIGYLLIVSWLGAQTAKRFGFEFQTIAARWLFGYLTIELAGLVCFFIANYFWNGSFVWGFLPLPIALLSLVGKTKTFDDGENDRHGAEPWAAIALTTIILMSLSTISLWQQITTALTSDGVIYQDLVFHSGISHAIREFGFPIPDLQYLGGEIRYHIFTHFLVAKLVFLTGVSEIQASLLILPMATCLAYSVAACSLLSGNRQSESTKGLVPTTLLVIAPIFVVALGGGNMVGTYVFSAMLSFSFAWQLIAFTLLLDYFAKSQSLSKPNADARNIYCISIFIVLATLIKGSSLPVLLGGLGLWCLIRIINQRKINTRDLVLVFLPFLAGVVTYIVFFSGSALGKTGFAFQAPGFSGSLWGVIFRKLSLDVPVSLQAGILLAAIVGCRFIVFREINKPVVWFYSGCLIVGTFFYFFFTNNPNYFLFPVIFMGNLLAAKILVRDFFVFHWFTKCAVVLLAFLSLYPVATGGHLSAAAKLERKQKEYYPLTPDRVALFNQLVQQSQPQDIIFTCSAYASPMLTADNFYPAALTGRQFLVGGYRFSAGESDPNFSRRTELVNRFDPQDQQQVGFLRDQQVRYVIVETQGNATSAVQPSEETQDYPDYRIVFRNSAGIIFSVVQTQ